MQKIQNRNPIQSPLLLSATFWYAVTYSYKYSSRNNTEVPIISAIVHHIEVFKNTRGRKGACRSETKYIYTLVHGSFAFTTPVPMAITILLEMTVPARCEPIITSFVLFSSSSNKRFGQFSLNFGYFHYFWMMLSRSLWTFLWTYIRILFWKLSKRIFSDMS